MSADSDQPLRASLGDRMSQVEADRRLRQLAYAKQLEADARAIEQIVQGAIADRSAAEDESGPTAGPMPPETERRDDMGKENMPAEPLKDYSNEEKDAILEKTRGLGDKALKEAAKELPVSRTTIYVWRKERWGTMNAHGIVTDKPKPKPKAAGPKAAKLPGRGQRRFTPEQWREHVDAAEASGRPAQEYERTHGLASGQLNKWRQQLGRWRPGSTKRTRGGFTPEDRDNMARAAIRSGSVRKYADDHGIPFGTLAGWVQSYKGRNAVEPAAAAPRALVPVGDTELIENYEQEKALAKAAKEPAQKLRDENVRLKKLVAVLKANLAYAIENGLVEHLTIDLMFGKKE